MPYGCLDPQRLSQASLKALERAVEWLQKSMQISRHNTFLVLASFEDGSEHELHLRKAFVSSALADHESFPGNITVEMDGVPFDTGLRKFGALLGDGADVGWRTGSPGPRSCCPSIPSPSLPNRATLSAFGPSSGENSARLLKSKLSRPTSKSIIRGSAPLPRPHGCCGIFSCEFGSS